MVIGYTQLHTYDTPNCWGMVQLVSQLMVGVVIAVLVTSMMHEQ